MILFFVLSPYIFINYMEIRINTYIQEPFRPIIDWKIRCAINLGQIKEEDFEIVNEHVVLKYKKMESMFRFL